MSEKDSPCVIAPPPLIFLCVLVSAFLLNMAYPLHIMSSPLRIILAAICIAYAALSGLLAFTNFKKAGTNVDVRKPATRMVTTGIYAYTRNPMYVALTLLLAGLSFYLNSLWLLILTPVFAVIIQEGVIKREEAYLEMKFGDEYTNYKKRVRRWL